MPKAAPQSLELPFPSRLPAAPFWHEHCSRHSPPQCSRQSALPTRTPATAYRRLIVHFSFIIASRLAAAQPSTRVSSVPLAHWTAASRYAACSIPAAMFTPSRLTAAQGFILQYYRLLYRHPLQIFLTELRLMVVVLTTVNYAPPMPDASRPEPLLPSQVRGKK